MFAEVRQSSLVDVISQRPQLKVDIPLTRVTKKVSMARLFLSSHTVGPFYALCFKLKSTLIHTVTLHNFADANMIVSGPSQEKPPRPKILARSQHVFGVTCK